MKEKMCCFDGDKTEFSEEKLKKAITELIKKENVRKFCFLRKSELDSVALAILKELKNEYPDIALGMILPNINIEFLDVKAKPFCDYDFFLTDKIAYETENGWFMKKFNHYMVECSDFLICHCNTKSGRAYGTIKYAESFENVKILNIAKI
ncbi:MAG: hypothetical protein IJR79_01425 [Clostridia bacterium]|nr:hypothetical protein [Clostridia bacterium]